MSQPITEVKDMVVLIASAVNTGLQASKDGKIDMNDLPLVFQFLQKVPAAIEGFEKIPSELSHLSEEESAELIGFAMQELQLGDHAKAARITEGSLKMLAAGYSLVQAIRS